jgi:protein associated with RNAse G/E
MKEDVRETLPVKANFFDTIKSLYEKWEMVHILYDDNGIICANGLITQVSEQDDSTYFVLDDATHIYIKTLIAVNGIFSADYSEC